MIGIIGAGGFGTALAVALAKAGREVGPLGARPGAGSGHADHPAKRGCVAGGRSAEKRLRSCGKRGCDWREGLAACRADAGAWRASGRLAAVWHGPNHWSLGARGSTSPPCAARWP